MATDESGESTSSDRGQTLGRIAFNGEPRECDSCRRIRPVEVASLAGVPMSVGMCKECWQQNCIPVFVAEGQIDICEGKEHVAEWFLEQTVYVDGKYIAIKDYDYTADPNFWSELDKVNNDK